MYYCWFQTVQAFFHVQIDPEFRQAYKLSESCRPVKLACAPGLNELLAANVSGMAHSDALTFTYHAGLLHPRHQAALANRLLGERRA